MRKQVYKVGKCGGVGNGHVFYGRSRTCSKCGEDFSASPLKPKKSIKKKEAKVQELERRIKALEAHRCNPMPQTVPYHPNVPEHGYYMCPNCGVPVGNFQVHYCR